MFQEIKPEFERQQAAISEWWIKHAIDAQNGGFYGAIDNNNQADKHANKGVIQQSRILWYFSEAAMHTGNTQERQTADFAFENFLGFFYDNLHNGVIWEVDYRGNPINTRKQIYGQAFAIYALSAYYRLTKSSQALHRCQQIFDAIECHAWDSLHHGYLEAFGQSWNSIKDIRLSPRDPNWPKSMNTHLHIMEAYTALYQIHPEPRIAHALERLIELIITRFMDPSGHLKSFFDRYWIDQSTSLSYGHDIECSWLLCRAAEVLSDVSLVEYTKKLALVISARVLQEAVDQHGGIIDGVNLATGAKQADHIWWVQAEALVGFLNAYELSQEPRYAQAFLELWKFTNQYHIDPQGGEWFWRATLDSPAPTETLKSSFWKGPYHNGRAMLELLQRLERAAGGLHTTPFKGHLAL